MSTEKRSFVLYHDIREPLRLLSDAERGRLFSAILDYSEFGIAPDFSGALGMAFAFVRTALDRDAAAWESKREKRREAGSLGGKQKVANQAIATFAKQIEQKVANQAVPVPAPVPVPVPVPVNEREGKSDKPPRSRFVPPTIAEIKEFCHEQNVSIDAGRFRDFYESNGWMVGKAKMKDWHAAVRNWARRESEFGGGQTDKKRVRTDEEYEQGWCYDGF